MNDYWLTPWKASLAITAAFLETSLTLQKRMLGMVQPGGMDPADMREAFRSAADSNLRRWGDTAEALKALPDWYQNAASVPGGLMTDAFDKARRLSQR
jgi:hypothetical protein